MSEAYQLENPDSIKTYDKEGAFILIVILIVILIFGLSIFIFKKKEWGKLRYLLIITLICLTIFFYPLLGLAAWGMG